jgi:hypothetical protein
MPSFAGIATNGASSPAPANQMNSVGILCAWASPATSKGKIRVAKK